VPRTIGQFIDNNYTFTLLRAAIAKTNLADTLNRPNTGTFFAPDDRAFNYMGISTVEQIQKMNTDSLRQALLGYMIPQRLFVSEFPAQMGNAFTTKSGRTLYVSVNGYVFGSSENRQLCVNGVPVMTDAGIKRNIALGNGVVHILQRLIKDHDMTVQDYLAADTSLSTFVVAMKRFNYWDKLKTANPITVFAPNNKAFEKKGITADSINRMDPAAFKPELFGIYHFNLGTKRIFSSDGWLIKGTVYKDDGIMVGPYSFMPNYGFNSYLGIDENYIQIARMDSQFGSNPDGINTTYYDGQTSVNSDHLTNNGIVHVIEDLLLYPEWLKK
jgi:uncharacterized surface protein with fasciclin (FAS1) repeats